MIPKSTKVYKPPSHPHSLRSEPKEIGDVSVPQGSILGGIIFVIYQNDFPENHPEGDEESILYADDDTDVAHDADMSRKYKSKQMLQSPGSEITRWSALGRRPRCW